MIALIDIGNTRFKYATYKQQNDCYQSPSNQLEASDSLSELFSEFNSALEEHWLETNLQGTSQVVFANVSDPLLSHCIISWAARKKISVKEVNTEKSHAKVVNGYEVAEQMGVDRWLALVGAQRLYPNQNLLIVDSGTATTFDLLDRNAQHQGGWILPGVELMANSVIASTVNVKGEHKQIGHLAFGRTTSSNLSYASWAATIGAVQQGILLAQQNTNKLDKVLFTGGNGQALLSHMDDMSTSVEKIFVEKLIFIGLACYSSS